MSFGLEMVIKSKKFGVHFDMTEECKNKRNSLELNLNTVKTGILKVYSIYTRFRQIISYKTRLHILLSFLLSSLSL